MTQLTDEHFELHTKNKAEQHERQKIKFLEDRIKVLESAIESHAKILARFQMTEDSLKDNKQILFEKMMLKMNFLKGVNNEKVFINSKMGYITKQI